MVWRCDSELDIQQLLAAAMDPQEFARFNQVWQDNGLDNDWLPLPVHPWQWQQKSPSTSSPILPKAGWFRSASLATCGSRSSRCAPLTNASRRGGLDIKLPLTIYNTSCYRGIPGKYIAAGPLASRWLQQVFLRPTPRLSKAAR
uniref:Aerobactin synthase, aerobactin biosynthesis protein IucC n=1 Tax=Klebsiella pneumoniae TaxID=573 RepID=A0A8B0SX97_KLEPN|nr:Aerobactin synthase, aerobactin biosynthesis protein IucC [Klebsiella pneumoniae]